MELLEVWELVHQEVVQLSDALARLPDACECGDARAHLEERCSCCGAAHGGHGSSPGETCLEVISRLRTDLGLLMRDFATIAGPIETLSMKKERLDLRRSLYLTAEDLKQIASIFEKVGQSVAGFLKNCTVSELRRAKRNSKALREHCDRLDAGLRSN